MYKYENKKTMKKITLILMLGLICGHPSISQILHVPADYPTIQEGIDASNHGDTVLVAPGTYPENIRFYGKAITVASHMLISGDTAMISQTQIIGEEGVPGRLVAFMVKEGPESMLFGFTLRTREHSIGGSGVYCQGSSPTLLHLRITDNSCYTGGVAIDLEDTASPLIVYAEIHRNRGTYDGAIACYNHCSPTIVNSRITENVSVVAHGGGIGCWYHCHPLLVNVIIAKDTAIGYGGGINCWDNSSLTLRNVLIADCYSYSEGGGIYLAGANLKMTNVTVSGNKGLYGGGIYASVSDISLTNSIIYGNEPSEVYIFEDGPPISLTAHYSLIKDGEYGIYHGNNCYIHWEEGNLGIDPEFLGTGEHPYLLKYSSPCIDAGIPDTAGLKLPGADPLGNIRIWDGNGDGTAVIDMGVFEYDAEPSAIGRRPETNHFGQLSVFPNPCRGNAHISFTLEKDQTVGIDLYGITGEYLCRLKNVRLPAGEHRIPLQLTTTKAGIYVLRISSETKASERQLIIY